MGRIGQYMLNSPTFPGFLLGLNYFPFCFHRNRQQKLHYRLHKHKVLMQSFKQLLLQLSLCCVCSVVSNSAVPWTVARQAPLSMGFSRQEYWSGLPFPPSGGLPNPGMEPTSLKSAALASKFLTTTRAIWEAQKLQPQEEDILIAAATPQWPLIPHFNQTVI